MMNIKKIIISLIISFFFISHVHSFENKILVKVDNQINDVAYMQVKDLTKNDNEKVYIFNGWTFSSSPSIQVFDHPVYDLWILKCY